MRSIFLTPIEIFGCFLIIIGVIAVLDILSLDTHPAYFNFVQKTEAQLSHHEFNQIYKNKSCREEIDKVISGEMNVGEITTPVVIDKLNKSRNLYFHWAKLTGNPKKLSKKQFDILMKKNLINEFKYDNWKKLTNNEQNLSEEQFNALKEEGEMHLLLPKKKEVFEKSEVW